MSEQATFLHIIYRYILVQLLVVVIIMLFLDSICIYLNRYIYLFTHYDLFIYSFQYTLFSCMHIYLHIHGFINIQIYFKCNLL